MFSKLSVLVALIPFVAGMTIDAPTDAAPGKTVTMTWTTTSGDPSTVSFEMVNPNDAGQEMAIGNNIDTSLGSFSFEVPAVVTPGTAFTIQAVNPSNINQVFGTSGPFTIAAASTSTSASSSTAASSRTSSGSAVSSGSATSSGTSSSSGRTLPSSSGSSSSPPPTGSTTNFNAGTTLYGNFWNVGSVGAMILGAVVGAAVIVL